MAIAPLSSVVAECDVECPMQAVLHAPVRSHDGRTRLHRHQRMSRTSFPAPSGWRPFLSYVSGGRPPHFGGAPAVA